MIIFWKMGSRVLVFVMLLCFQIPTLAVTDSNDFAALSAIRSSWRNLPRDWQGSDPCGRNWTGITCNDTQVTSLILGGVGVESGDISDISSLTGLTFLDLSNNVGLTGNLPPSIGNLRNLSTLILINCGFSGPIPDSIGSLQQLIYISLSNNRLIGPIPPSIGNLTQLSWLDLSYNRLTGTLPVSNDTSPGLDMLLTARHFHLSRNQLSGSVPDQLFNSSMALRHAIFDNNQLTGNLPLSLARTPSLELIRFDSNNLNGSVPPNLNNLTNLSELYLSNNNFNGNIPNLTGLDFLSYVDMSNNSFTASGLPQWLSRTQSLKTIIMENAGLEGPVSSDLFGLPQLETVVLSNNNITGSLDVGNTNNNNLTIDLRNNSIASFPSGATSNVNISLAGNPYCDTNGATPSYCSNGNQPNNIVRQNLPNNFFQQVNCGSMSCRGNEVLSPNCRCTHPYTGTIQFFSITFTNLQNFTYYRALNLTLMRALLADGLPVDSIIASDPVLDISSYPRFSVQIFPSNQDSFNEDSVSRIGRILNRQDPTLFQSLEDFGPFLFLDQHYCCFPGSGSSNIGLVVGVVVGCSILVILIVLVGVYALRQKRKAKRAQGMSNPFESWDPEKESGTVPQLQGAKWFSFEDLRKCTNGFSETNYIGAGGYGKVYKGTVPSGQVVAIKRAQQGSMQGAYEFKTEIELLSRIHHKNVVSLVGFCYEQGEQMLVYDYISNGTLKECLSAKLGSRLDWNRRLGIALDAAKGLQYLHELADPPIIHRDIKSTNILLDNHLIAKVADFGLSKLVGDTGKGYITTQVKGTLGYMDPEYYMTQQLTDKSDVYSFGVVLLELITGRAPIQHGKHIVRLVQESIGDAQNPQNLEQVIDPNLLKSNEKIVGSMRFIDMAMSCVRETAADRPSMREVVREIENIMEMAPYSGNNNKRTDAVVFSLSSSFGKTSEESPLHSSNVEEGFDVSYGSFPFRVERH